MKSVLKLSMVVCVALLAVVACQKPETQGTDVNSPIDTTVVRIDTTATRDSVEIQ